MKRSFSIIFAILFSVSPLMGMNTDLQSRTSCFDRVPARISRYLYGLPEFFSVKHQLQKYGIAQDGDGFEQLDQAVYQEVSALLNETDVDIQEIFMVQLHPEKAQGTPGFVVTSGGIFIDQAWWLSIDTQAESQEIKRFFIAVMADQYLKGQYRKNLATKMLVDGVLVSVVIGIATYTIAPTICSWVAETVPGTSWLEGMTSGIATTANQTCDQFYSPSLCIMAGKTAWSSLLAPGVGPCVHALLSEPVANYLAQQSCTKALESVVNKQALADYCKEMKKSGSAGEFDQVLSAVEQSDDDELLQDYNKEEE